MESWLIAFSIILGYMVLTLIIGFLTYKPAKKTTADEYFLMGRNIGPFLLFWTTLATLQSAFAFLGAVGKFYVEGIGFIVLPLSQGLMITTLTFVIGHRLWLLAKHRGYLTPSDFFDDRYRSVLLRLIVSFVGVFFTLFYLSMQYVGSAHAITGITGGHVPYILSLVIVTIVTGLYTILGGMRAIVWTDFIQGVLLFSMSIVATSFIVSKLGGMPGILREIAKVKPEYLSLPGPANVYTDVNWIMFFLVLPFGIWLGPQIMVRFFAAKDKKSIYAATLSIPISQIWLFMIAGPLLGFSAYLVYGPGLPRPDQALPRLVADFVPLALGSLIMSGAIAAAMSTVDSMVLVITQMITKDFIVVGAKKKLPDEKVVTLGRIIAAVLTVISFAIAFSPPKLLINVIIGITFTAIAQLAPGVILGFFWRRANKYGITSGLVAGIAILFILRALKLRPLGIPDFLWAFGVNWLLSIVVSLLTPPPPKEALKEVVDFVDELIYKKKM